MFYLSNFIPISIVLMVVYDFPLDISTLYGKVVFSATIVLFALSVLGLISWIRYLGKLNHDNRGDAKIISKYTDLSGQITIYYMVYLLLFLYIIMIGGTKSIILFFAFVIVVGVLSLIHMNTIMTFNPFLSLLGYRLYLVELSDGSKGHVIAKLSGGPILLKDRSLYFIMIDNYLYYVNL